MAARRTTKIAVGIAAASLAMALGPGAPTSTWASTTKPRIDAAQAHDGGPMSPWGRRPRPSTISRAHGVVTSTFDLGDATLPGTRYRTPVRGMLTLPARGSHLPVLVVLRQHPAGCTHQVHAYPCPAGTGEVHSDSELASYAAAVARRGTAVLVPDLAPVSTGTSPTTPYSRAMAVQTVVTRETKALALAAAGARDTVGQPVARRLDMHRVSMRTHV